MSAANRNPERWEELVADDALAGLSTEEREELRAAVNEEIVRAEKPLFERAAGELAAAAFAAQSEKEQMPAAVQRQILARIDAALPKPRVRERRPFPTAWLLAAAAILVAVLGWMRVPAPREAQPSPDRQRTELLALAGTIKRDFTATKDPAARNASGDVLWHSGRQRGFMRIRGLAPNDRAIEQYQLWIFDADRDEAYPVDGGVFDVTPNERGEVIVPIEAKLTVGKPKLFAITVEKPGGVVVSKRERIVLTATSS